MVVRSRGRSCFEPEYSWFNVFCGDFSTKALFVWYIILIFCKLLIYCGIFFIDLFTEVFVKGLKESCLRCFPPKKISLSISVLFLLSNTGMLLSLISGRTDLSSVFPVIFLKVFQTSLALFAVLNSLTNLSLQVSCASFLAFSKLFSAMHSLCLFWGVLLILYCFWQWSRCFFTAFNLKP